MPFQKGNTYGNVPIGQVRGEPRTPDALPPMVPLTVKVPVSTKAALKPGWQEELRALLAQLAA
jgi:hypothetical protein